MGLYRSQSLTGSDLISELGQVLLKVGNISFEDTDDSDGLAIALP